MPITSHNAIVSRISDGFSRTETIDFTQPALFNSSTSLGGAIVGPIKAVPTLESGVTSYVPTAATIVSLAAGAYVNRTFLIGRLFNLGSLDIGSNVFTDGVSMGTRTEGNSTVSVASAVFCEVTTALNATPGTLNITYTDQDGNTGNIGTTALGASWPVGAGGLIPLSAEDWGARDITAASRSGGTSPSGVIRFWGIIPLDMLTSNTEPAAFDFIYEGLSTIKLAAGESLGFVQLLTTSLAAMRCVGSITYVGDN